MSAPRKLITWLVAACLVPVAMLAIYVGAYLWLGNHHVAGGLAVPIQHYRWYPKQWQVRLFEPGARIESKLRGEAVSVEHDYFP